MTGSIPCNAKSKLRTFSEAVEEFIPSYRSLLVEYDPAKYGYQEMHDRVAMLVESGGVATASRVSLMRAKTRIKYLSLTGEITDLT